MKVNPSLTPSMVKSILARHEYGGFDRIARKNAAEALKLEKTVEPRHTLKTAYQMLDYWIPQIVYEAACDAKAYRRFQYQAYGE